ncbi:MAG: hypothetical protein ACK515_04300 [bacterium]|nr:hypothetical protein [Betaproteobacteria bacterium]
MRAEGGTLALALARQRRDLAARGAPSVDSACQSDVIAWLADAMARGTS